MKKNIKRIFLVLFTTILILGNTMWCVTAEEKKTNELTEPTVTQSEKTQSNESQNDTSVNSEQEEAGLAGSSSNIIKEQTEDINDTTQLED